LKRNVPIRWTARAVQYAVAVHLDFFRYCVVPNIHLGGNDDMDMAILSPSKLLWEVEIKVTMDDWKRDLDKRKWQLSVQPWTPARFYYAVPSRLVKRSDSGFVLPDWLPELAGVLEVRNNRTQTTLSDGTIHIVDKPTVIPLRAAKPRHRQQLPEKYVYEMYRKLSIRYWRSAYKNDPGETFNLPEE